MTGTEQSASKEEGVHDERLWEFLFKQQDYVVQEFFTAVVGIGALFFAYGSIANPYVRFAVALIGLGASVIVWMHAWGSHEQMVATKKEIGKTELSRRFEAIEDWRDKSWKNRWLYHPVTRLMTYFAFLVASAWFLIVVDDFLDLNRAYVLFSYVRPVTYFVSVGLLISAIVIAFAWYRKWQDRRRKKGEEGG